MNKKLLILSLILLSGILQQTFLFSALDSSDAAKSLIQIKNYLQSIEYQQNAKKTVEFAGAHIGGTVGVSLLTVAALITFELIARKVIKSRGRDVGVLWDVVRACFFPITPHHIEIVLAHKKLALEVFALYGTLTVGTISTVLSGVNAGIRTDCLDEYDWTKRLSLERLSAKIDKLHLKSL